MERLMRGSPSDLALRSHQSFRASIIRFAPPPRARFVNFRGPPFLISLYSLLQLETSKRLLHSCDVYINAGIAMCVDRKLFLDLANRNYASCVPK